MDKEQATKILANELVKLNGQKFIVNPAYQKQTLEKAIYYYPIEHEKPFSLQTYIEDVNNITSGEVADFTRRYKARITSYCSGVKDANYVFTEHFENVSQTRSSHSTFYSYFVFTNTFSFFALIGEEEVEYLKKHVYKDVPFEVVTAMNTVGIKHFVDAYSIYSSLKGGEFLILRFGIYRPFEKEDKIELGDIIRGSKSGRYFLVDKIKNNGSVGGYRFQDEALEIPVEGKGDDAKYGECGNSYIIPVKKRLSDINFFGFVFSLPYEDQNIEVNKTIIKDLSDVDSCDILQQEYSQGKHFKDYFLVLDEECKKRVIEGIKSLPKQDQFLNSWLFSQGFDVKMDYLELYKKDAKGFINYFKRSSKDVQELIVSDLFNCEHINDEVIAFLEKEYSNLLRDVSFKKEVILQH